MTRVAPAFLTCFQAIQTGSEPIRGLAAGTCRSATGNERLSTAAVGAFAVGVCPFRSDRKIKGDPRNPDWVKNRPGSEQTPGGRE
jgi:hypothetical protein